MRWVTTDAGDDAMAEQATISEDDLYATIAEAFQALRQDDYVQDLPAGSQRRRDRITRILDPIASANGMTTKELAGALARSMTPHQPMTPPVRI